MFHQTDHVLDVGCFFCVWHFSSFLVLKPCVCLTFLQQTIIRYRHWKLNNIKMSSVQRKKDLYDTMTAYLTRFGDCHIFSGSYGCQPHVRCRWGAGNWSCGWYGVIPCTRNIKKDSENKISYTTKSFLAHATWIK